MVDLFRGFLAVGLLVFCPAAGASAAEATAVPEAASLGLGQIQVIGTHNSYHLRPNPELLKIAAAVRPDAKEWDYEHAPLDVQLDRGVRSFEIDLHLSKEGWEVFHVPVIDNRSSCPRFEGCLEKVRAWSDKHPGHVPVSFLLEIKDEGVVLDKRLRAPDETSLLELDRLIRSVFPRERRLEPDDVRQGAATLEEGVLKNGWPTLGRCRGRVLFLLHERGRNREMYVKGAPALEGRAMFVNSSPGRADAATLVLDNPRDPKIPELARKGYLIRTRADAREPNASATRRDRALQSGAHIVSTDFPPGERDPKSGFVVEFPSAAPARVNPVSGPERVRGRVVLEPIEASRP